MKRNFALTRSVINENLNFELSKELSRTLGPILEKKGQLLTYFFDADYEKIVVLIFFLKLCTYL